ncbi:trypsin-like peptidase domain-containing protein [Pseudoalteromonas tunicata]|uniref:trypsin-like peptidase domain-containing protein n=1 Tax=Pseudoalteromonas tunicata TaxID=314281 RepID=UPI000590A653|nr:trypsin-like peptidase domain-containing protein [Pseudoalteromonas tunicata]AXT32365.1 PDZ domain-containing protein [Pseudoalteromonas tunicata]MDP4983047.1 trypsin-like peptidase domain-containing protein [Pseudoalteromonas tunicata]MDP5213492.1 trypsin-like peptidase domain-containing protein [Pseudoalteromonas tunicata]
MLTKIKFLLVPIFVGLALAFIVLLFMPSLRPLQWQNATVSDAITSSHLSFANAVKRASPAVVTIYSETFTNQPRYMRGQNSIQELGSGVIMSDKGYILTNYHVINNADQVMITLTDGRQFNDVQLIGFDTVTDLALLKIEAQHLPVIPIDDKFVPQVGDVVLAIGNPLNLGQTITQGIISATGKQNLPQKSSHSNLLQMDAAINVGNSGGALVNSNGILVGINSAQFKAQRNIDIQGIFFAVPYFLAKEVMNKLIKHGQVVRGYLGFNADPVDNTGKQLTNPLTPIFGMQLNSIDPLGPAWQAGLKEGDIVVKIDNKKIVNLQLTLEQIADTLPESIIMFEVYRDGQPLQINVKVGKLEPVL